MDFIVNVIDNDNTAPEVDAGPDRTVSRSGSGPWSPAPLSPAAWYDAADASTLWADTVGGNLATTTIAWWEDKSGNSRHLESTSSPSTGGDINGVHAIRAADGDYFSVAGFGTGTYDIFFVMRGNNSGNTGDVSLGGNTNNSYLGIATSGSTSNSNILRINGTDEPAGAAILFNGETTQSVSTRGALYNEIGTQAFLVRFANIPVLTSPIKILEGHNPNWEFVGDAGEILFVASPTPEEAQKLEGYLAHKWGLQAKLPADHPYKDAAPGSASATATLAGSASDADGDPLVTTWSMVSGPGPVSFEDIAAVNTTATFSGTGAYVLRLTAFDGQDTTYDEITITVTDTVQETFSNWIAGFDLSERTGFNDDYNHDGVSNGMKYFFGIDPTVPSLGLSALALDMSERNKFSFAHPMGENVPAGIHGEYRWSKDLSTFHADGASDADGTTVTFVRGAPVDGMVTVTATITGTPTDRIFVTLAVSQLE